MLNFCTLYHSNYAAKALAMYWSLRRVCPDFHLYILAMDEQLVSLLEKQRLSNVTIITLSEFEDEELLRVKPTRSIAEYCWTCTASLILYCLQQYDIDHCTYIDSDLYFYANPQIMLDDMGTNDVLITPHWFAPEDDISERVGTYCVQFVVARNTPNALRIISDWRKDCLDWCYSQYEDGKMGDQMYLDKWPETYKGVFVSDNRGGGVAPWNMLQYKFKRKEDVVVGREITTGKTFPLVFFHYHACHSRRKGIVREFNYPSGGYDWDKETWDMLFKPYAKQLIRAYRAIKRIDKTIDGLATQELEIDSWWNYLKTLYLRHHTRHDFRFYYWID